MDVSVLSIFSSRMIFIIAHQSQEPDYVFDLLPCLLIYFHVLSMKRVGFDDGIPNTTRLQTNYVLSWTSNCSISKEHTVLLNLNNGDLLIHVKLVQVQLTYWNIFLVQIQLS
jgi:hypothetical protein